MEEGGIKMSFMIPEWGHSLPGLTVNTEPLPSVGKNTLLVFRGSQEWLRLPVIMKRKVRIS